MINFIIYFFLFAYLIYCFAILIIKRDKANRLYNQFITFKTKKKKTLTTFTTQENDERNSEDESNISEDILIESEMSIKDENAGDFQSIMEMLKRGLIKSVSDINLIIEDLKQRYRANLNVGSFILLGILGTFFGLLQSFGSISGLATESNTSIQSSSYQDNIQTDAKKQREAINGLLNGTYTALGTSIVGMIACLIVLIFQYYMNKKIDSKIIYIRDNLIEESNSFEKSINDTQESLNNVMQYFVELIGKFEPFSHSLDLATQNFHQSIQGFSQIEQKLFEEKRELVKSWSELNQTTGSIVDKLLLDKDSMVTYIDALSSHVNSFKDLSDNIQQVTRRIDDKTKSYDDMSITMFDSYKVMMDKFMNDLSLNIKNIEETFNIKIATLFDDKLSVMNTILKESISENGGYFEKIASELNNIRGTVEKIDFAELNTSVLNTFNNGMQSLNNIVENRLTETGDSFENMKANIIKMREIVEELNLPDMEKLVNELGALNSQMNVLENSYRVIGEKSVSELNELNRNVKTLSDKQHLESINKSVNQLSKDIREMGIMNVKKRSIFKNIFGGHKDES